MERPVQDGAQPVLEAAVRLEGVETCEFGPQASLGLRGHVRTAPEVKHAVTMARGVPGVTRVRERLSVVRPR